MKKIITLTAAVALALPTIVVADSQEQANAKMLERIQSGEGANSTPKVRKSTAAPALGLTPGLVAAGIAITVIGIAAIAENNNSTSTTN